jgi:hypothetical protein
MISPQLKTLLAFAALLSIASANSSFDPFPFSPGFDIQAVNDIATSLPTHSWEYGTHAETALELYNPEYSVFGSKGFPVPKLDATKINALIYAKKNIVFGTGADVLQDGDGAVGDPASLGVSAILLGQTDATYWDAATEEMGYITGTAPKYWNGAISQRSDVAELWFVLLPCHVTGLF